MSKWIEDVATIATGARADGVLEPVELVMCGPCGAVLCGPRSNGHVCAAETTREAVSGEQPRQAVDVLDAARAVVAAWHGQDTLRFHLDNLAAALDRLDS